MDTEVTITPELESSITDVSRDLYAIRNSGTVSLNLLRGLQDKIDALRQDLMATVDAAS